MKKRTVFISLIAALACAIGLAACSHSDDDKAPKQPDTIDQIYARAVDLGFDGTLEEFIEMLRGADGTDGKDGVDGKDGTDGKDGVDGKDGADGKNGVDGKDGADGKDGVDGKDGADGVDGKDGKDGVNGKDGRGILSVTVNGDGELVVVYTDGAKVNLGKVSEPQCKHNMIGISVAPTCTDRGYTEYKCSRCGMTTYKFKEAKGHVFADSAIILEPAVSCIQPGVALRQCSICNTARMEQVLGEHSYVDGTCTVCGMAQTSDGLQFKYNNDRTDYMVSGLGDCTDTDIVIPDRYNGLPVTGIGTGAFMDKNITSVTIPNSIITIGASAFRSAAIESIVIPDSVTLMGMRAFSDCEKLKTVVLSNSLTEIGRCLFMNCSALNSVTLGDNITTICTLAFRGCTNLESITLPSSVRTIDMHAFADSGLTSITFPNGLEIIKPDAFARCKELTSIVFSSNVELSSSSIFSGCTALKSVHFCAEFTLSDFETYCFRGLPLANITVSPENPLYRAAYGCLVEKNGSRVVLGGVEAQLPDDGSITAIGKNAFYGRAGLSSIVIPASVTDIEEYAFSDCADLTSAELNHGLKTIGDYAFRNSGVTSVEIPDSVTHVGRSAFLYCNSLTTVHIGNGVQVIGVCAFNNGSITDLTVSADNDVYYSVQNNIVHRSSKTLVCGNASGVIPDDGSIVAIGCEAYAYNKGLKRIVIPSSVKSIEYYAFEYCSGLETVVFNEGLEIIDSHSFNHCDKLREISIPSTVKRVEFRAFWACDLLETVNIAEGVQIIGEEAFDSCAFTTLVIPKSVTRIYENALDGCSNLTAVFYAGSESDWLAVRVYENNAVLNEFVHFYSETAPSADGKYWHYVDGVPTVW